MNTGRVRLVAIGLVSAMLVSGSLGLPGSVSAQSTKSGIKAKGKEAENRGAAKWESLTPDQKQKLAQTWKMDAAKAEAKWHSLTPEQQQQATATGKADVQKGKQKWQQLPAGSSTPPAPTTSTK